MIYINGLACGFGAMFTGQYSDYGTDIDQDGLYEFLTIEVGVHIMTPGEYSLMGFLYDINNKEVDWSADHKNYTNGDHIMRLNFDSQSLKNHGIGGQYRLGNLTMMFGSSDTGLGNCDYIQWAYITHAYNLSDFKY